MICADMASSLPIDNKKKYILILCRDLRQGLDDANLTAQKEQFINFTEQQKKFCLSLHYNEFVNGIEIYKLKENDSEANSAPLCLGNVSKDFSADKMKKTGLCGYIYDFSVNFEILIVFMFLMFWIFVNN